MHGRHWLVFSCLALSACFYDRSDHVQACESDRECSSAARCYDGFCISANPDLGSCTQSNRIESCYQGQPADSAGVGSCKAGQRFCIDGTYSECLGQVTPQDELCNGRDDDCDGAIDNTEAMSACDTQLPGACNEGALMCRDGVGFCQPLRASQAESCNAIDDDCDGAVDELAMGQCYPSGIDGCVHAADGSWQCSGLCTTGQASCESSAELCEGAIPPTDEACEDDSTLAQDEDCDGAIDETCDCMSGAVRACYAGPIGTRDMGICKPGTQACSGTAWGPCIGQTLPALETCANPDDDDDCNGVEDDIIGVDSPCIADSEMGECRNGTLECNGDALPECVGADPIDEICDELDQDCDGYANGFDFASDEKTCGACDVQCDADRMCCEGSCIDPASLQGDDDNCGACGSACGAGRYCCQGDCLSMVGAMQPACTCDSACGDRSCCGNNCRDLDADRANCGACGRKCGRDESCVDGTCRR